MGAITVGVPSYDGLKAITAFSLVSAVACLRAGGHDVHLVSRQGPYTHWNREGLVENAVDAGTDHLMMIDADMSFPADGVVRLLGRDKDVIGGFYLVKTEQPMNTIKLHGEDGEYAGIEDWTPPQEPFRAAAVATGFMLINMDVIKKLDPPYFPCVQPVGEDVAFCQKVEAAGMEVWCDPTFKIGHIGDFIY